MEQQLLPLSPDAKLVWDNLGSADLITWEIEQAIRRLSHAQLTMAAHLEVVKKAARLAFFDDTLITG